MPTPRLTFAIAVSGLLLAAAPSAMGRQLSDNWPVLASDRDGSCRLSITGNGRIMQLRAVGLVPGERARFALTNAAMKPIDWTVRAGPSGEWSQIYIPFLWGNGDGSTRTANSGGTVSVNLSAARCSLGASADWRREIRVIP